MVVTKDIEMGESSTAAAKKSLTANANGATNYELPWYMQLLLIYAKHDAHNP
jgi:hypothetical protein